MFIETAVTRGNRLTLFLLIGTLSMFMAEVFAGSSQIWFIDAWSLFITFPLYLGHLLFFLNLAMRTKRTSVPQLYLWGVLFGLYESWITKVLWFGYPGAEGAQFGLIAGIAIGEFITLVFFWHPIMAFLMPILVYQSLALSNQKDLKVNRIVFSSHISYFNSNNKKHLYSYIIIMCIGAGALSINAGYDLIVILLAILGSVGLIYSFFKLSSRKSPGSFSIHSLRLGKKGFSIVISYLFLLYGITFFLLLPQRLPTELFPYLIIIVFYVFIVIMLKLTKVCDEGDISALDRVNRECFYSKGFFFKCYCLFLSLAVIFCLIPEAGLLYTVFVMLGMAFLGAPFFIIMLIKALRYHAKTKRRDNTDH